MARKRKHERLTPNEAARWLGISPRRLWDWVALGLPRNDDGTFDSSTIAGWRAERSRTAQNGHGAENGSDRTMYEAKRARLRSEREQLELDRELGNLIDVQIPAKLFAQHIAEVKSHLEQLPEYVLSLLPTSVNAKQRRHVRDELAERIDELCQVFANALDEWARQLESENPAEHT